MNTHNCNVFPKFVQITWTPMISLKDFYVCPFGNKRRLDFEVWQDRELQDVIADRWPTSSSSPPSPSSSSSARSETRNIETWSFLIEQNDWWCISTPYHNFFVGRYNSFTHFKWRSEIWFDVAGLERTTSRVTIFWRILVLNLVEIYVLLGFDCTLTEVPNWWFTLLSKTGIFYYLFLQNVW